MTKRITAAIAALMMVIGFTLMGATPAQADQYDCDSRRQCLWEHTRYRGTLRQIFPQHRTCVTLWGFNDSASSYWNNTRAQVWLYTNNNCSGTAYYIPAHSSRSSMSNGYNDRASSVWFNCPATGC